MGMSLEQNDDLKMQHSIFSGPKSKMVMFLRLLKFSASKRFRFGILEKQRVISNHRIQISNQKHCIFEIFNISTTTNEIIININDISLSILKLFQPSN